LARNSGALKKGRIGIITTRPEKVLYVWDYLEWGGAQIHWFALMREVKNFCPVTVVIPQGSDAQLIGFLDKVGVPYEFLPFHRNIKPASGIAKKIQRHLDKLRVEYGLIGYLKKYPLKDGVLHIDLAPWQSLLALMYLCRRAGKDNGQVFLTMHNRIWSDSALRRASWKFKLWVMAKFGNYHILASNKDAREGLRLFAPKSFVDKIEVTYTSINPPEIDEVLRGDFDRKALCRKFGLTADKFTVICIGQFIDRKGRWTFLEAAQKLKSSGEDIQFVWVSNSRPGDEDLAKIESCGLGENFRLIMNDRVGNERSDLLRMYRLGDVFVLASFVEGLPIALLEAMALKVPSVSTNVNGIPEAIKHLDTGWLIEAGDSDALAEAILTLKNDPALREKLAENGREIALREFDEREAAKTALACYIKAFEN
jgi:glycosyltransferase involved in cell wall biosynthesis